MKNETLLFGYFDGICGLGIEMTLEQAQSCSHSGQCDQDVDFLLEQPEITSQFDKIDNTQLKRALKEYGAWDDEELEDYEQNKKRALWSAASDITENNS